jgi:hypothetical protein
MTFAQLDALENERRAKRIELEDRLTKVLSKAFSASELRFIWVDGAPNLPLIRAAIQRARIDAK